MIKVNKEGIYKVIRKKNTDANSIEWWRGMPPGKSLVKIDNRKNQ